MGLSLFSRHYQGHTTGRENRVYTYPIGLLRQAVIVVVENGSLASRGQPSYGHHCTVGLRQRLMCYDGELKARQEHQQGSGQQKSLRVLGLGRQ